MREQARRQFRETRGLTEETPPGPNADQLAAIRDEARRRYLEEQRSARAAIVREEVPRRPTSTELATPGPSRPNTAVPVRREETEKRRLPPGCLNCHRLGHSWKSCDETLRLDFCRRCNRDGVTTRDCPGPHGRERARLEGRLDRVPPKRVNTSSRSASIDMACPRCYEDGHGPRDCTRPWTANSTPYCVSCYRVGYTQSTCPSCNRRRY